MEIKWWSSQCGGGAVLVRLKQWIWGEAEIKLNWWSFYGRGPAPSQKANFSREGNPPLVAQAVRCSWKNGHGAFPNRSSLLDAMRQLTKIKYCPHPLARDIRIYKQHHHRMLHVVFTCVVLALLFKNNKNNKSQLCWRGREIFSNSKKPARERAKLICPAGWFC